MDTLKTTVYLDRSAYEQLKAVARRQGKKPAELVREAVALYVQKHGRGLPGSLGKGRSGQGDLSERAEELLEGLGRS
ncbi:MAG: hypothetical protein KatS3mg077_2984 [Candidatus Binatia bacterium]|nr:MAG: hypothetical protein KatS3mg077_2984 [Candidatus Binatia bacterium]